MYFQNPFTSDFIGVLVIGDKHYSQDFKCPRNAGRGDEYVVSWIKGPYNLSGNDSDGNPSRFLNLRFALNIDSFKNWADISIDIGATAAVLASTQAFEVVSALNANVGFAGLFIASLSQDGRVLIRQTQSTLRLKFYIINGQGEETLRFNGRAGVAELPTYFDKHTVANRFNFVDALNLLIYLDPATFVVDANVIDNAVDANGVSLGLNSAVVQEDWQLFRGKSGIFIFKKITVDGSNRITEIIEYPAGAIAGDFAKKTQHVYTGANTFPDQSTEIPYTLATGDLVTP